MEAVFKKLNFDVSMITLCFINLSKCTFMVPELEVLGHIINSVGTTRRGSPPPFLYV